MSDSASRQKTHRGDLCRRRSNRRRQLPAEELRVPTAFVLAQDVNRAVRIRLPPSFSSTSPPWTVLAEFLQLPDGQQKQLTDLLNGLGLPIVSKILAVQQLQLIGV